ncbi:Asx homology domain-containing protein [Aspergillus granulosus]|uniref:Asx homology domain-containing protein n=1 Tax=Aspergillus granulosus TaxID=176169 RepID=A0ABR4HKH5_9EURO
MARGRKAVLTGSLRLQPARNRPQSSSAEAADPSDAANPGLSMDSTNPKPKRTIPRRAAKDRWEEEKLLTSDKSQLIDLPLVKLLALPEAWECLEEAEKKQILDLLPADTHPNPHPPPDEPDAKIPPLPESFVRYGEHWRDAIRHFQLDLQTGRYDPQWVREAEEAVQQRAAGKFDKFKEQEFEEFWGQKQKMDRTLAAGQSSAVKLSTLIEHGVVRKGDIWKWSRSFSKPKTLVEKEARIIDIIGHALTFVIPPGQRVFLKPPLTQDARDSVIAEKPVTPLKTPPISPLSDTPVVGNEEALDTIDGSEALASRKRSAEPETQTAVKRLRGHPPAENKANIAVESINLNPEAEETPTIPNGEGHVEQAVDFQNGNGNSQPSDEVMADLKPAEITNEEELPSPSSVNGAPDEIIVPDITLPTGLTLKMLEVDGRVKPTNGNAWKEIRCFRDNQDMGTLWEVRQAWYVKNK